jgi:hypothetical protein
MAPEPEEVAWAANYFNFFTEVEEHFQKTRATGLFLMSPLDWALVEAWKNAGVPLEAVLRGIDVAFEKWRARKSRIQMVNSLAYCAQAVLTEAQVMAGTAKPASTRKEAAAPFSPQELERYLLANALEEKMIAIARTRQSNEQFVRARGELDRQLRPYRGKMTTEQLAMLEKQYLEREVLASAALPRLSLFYLR